MIVPAMLLIYSFRFSTRPHNSGVLLRSFVTIIIQNVQSGVKRVFERCKSALISLLDRDCSPRRTVLLILLNMVKKSYISRCRVAQFF